MKYEKEIRVGGVSIGNRIAMAPMMTGKPRGGAATEELNEYYAVRSGEGRVGLIIVECATAWPSRLYDREILDVSAEGDMASLKRLTESIHGAGSRTFLQIGLAAPLDINELTKEDMEALTRDFAAAALRTKEAGFDGVEFHSAHAAIFNKFLSPLVNKRQDEYGPGSVEDRVRFHLDVLKATREAVGEDFPIGYRLGVSDYQEGGTTEEEGVRAAMILAKAGCDFLDISGGMNGSDREDKYAPGYYKEPSGKIREELVKAGLSCAVITAGGVERLDEAEMLLERGAADIISIGRALLRDPDWAKKGME